ncbi:5' exonuclease Apollo-like [Impatiens glandulifera]|uniref:5' exonuclease Apollo-like n=1 Tax=Impatiens glandulifera TaxID=253017 RepID=UPI001FB15854|nr:5' exonuclease Apollo-like [Impatiens glandulifera]
MPIEMPRGLPFSVDTWTPSSKKKRHHFLTHAHKDHSQGIATHSAFPIYSTRLTKTLVLQYSPRLDDSLFATIEVGQTLIIDDSDGAFRVTAFDANHCPGAVMFLFEGSFGNILHTGDCRLAPECLQNMPEKYIGRKDKEPKCRLDYVFLDCTFGRSSMKMPSKHSAIQQVIRCIWNHPDAKVVYLACDLLGQEEVLVEVCKTFGSKIFIQEANTPESFSALMLTSPQIITMESTSRFRMLNAFPNLPERAKAKVAEAKYNFQPEPLIIRPSAQWYVCDDELSELERQIKQRSNGPLKDQFDIWHVCYSMHSSREELEWALQLLAPQWVVSTTPNCRAMELDYVKRRCFDMKLAHNSHIWKLLDIDVEVPTNSAASIENSSHTSGLDDSSQVKAEETVRRKLTPQKLQIKLSPQSKSSPITLFGRARIGIENVSHMHEAKVSLIGVSSQVEQKVTLSEENRSKIRNKDESIDIRLVVDEMRCKNPVEAEIDEISPDKDGIAMNVASTECFGKSFRNLYRSMNVPVPQPLPSLVELMNTCKRAKRSL